MKIALDTNILAYVEGVGDEVRCEASHELLAALPADGVVLPAQTLGELFRVLTGKRGLSPQEARDAVLSWSDAYEVCDSTCAAFLSAMDLAADHRMQIWDGLILSVAAEVHCRMLLSEDLQHGFTWRGVTVVNPYVSPPHPLLKPLLNAQR
jgi:predicted nucleic acid-binding protein